MDKFEKVEEIHYTPKTDEEYKLLIKDGKIVLMRKVDKPGWKDITDLCTFVPVKAQEGGYYIKVSYGTDTVACCSLDGRPPLEGRSANFVNEYRIEARPHSHVSCLVFRKKKM